MISATLSDVQLVLLMELQLKSESEDAAVRTIQSHFRQGLKAFRDHASESAWLRCVTEARRLQQEIAKVDAAAHRDMSEVERRGDEAVRTKRASERYRPRRAKLP